MTIMKMMQITSIATNSFLKRVKEQTPVRSCKSDMWDYLSRMRAMRHALAFKFSSFFRANEVPPQMRPLAALMNDLHFMVTTYPNIRERIGRIVRSVDHLNHEAKIRARVHNRLIVTAVIKYLTAKDGLGFKPTYKNSATGSVMLYSLLKEAGLCPRLVKTAESSDPRFCVSVVIDPIHPDKPTIIDLTHLIDYGVTAESVIDFYDDIVTIKTMPVSVSNLLNRLT
jgi:hypothetical protein